MRKLKQNIIIFDGLCNLCEASIQFILKHDKKAHFYFTARSSKLGKELLDYYDLKELDSLVLISDDKAYIHSDAVLEIMKNLDVWFKYIYFFRFLPKFLRDGVYRFIAKYRYVVFGKKEHCLMPTKALKERFLEQ